MKGRPTVISVFGGTEGLKFDLLVLCLFWNPNNG